MDVMSLPIFGLDRTETGTLSSVLQENMYFDYKKAELPTLPDAAEDFLIFRENKQIQVHKFDNLPDSGNFLSIKLYVIQKIFLIGEENLPDCKMLMLAALKKAR